MNKFTYEFKITKPDATEEIHTMKGLTPQQAEVKKQAIIENAPSFAKDVSISLVETE